MNKYACLALTALGLTLSSLGMAAPEPEQNLQKIQKDIKKTQQNLSVKKKKQENIQETITLTDKEIAENKKILARIKVEKNTKLSHLKALEEDTLRLQNKVTSLQAQVARLLNAQYQNKQSSALILMLQNKNPNDKGRFLEYMRYLQMANQSVIQELGTQHAKLTQQAEAIELELKNIQALVSKHNKLITELTHKHQKQMASFSHLDKEITQENSTITQLKKDQQQLTALLKQLAAAKSKKLAEERAQKLKEKNTQATANKEAITKISVPSPNPAPNVLIEERINESKTATTDVAKVTVPNKFQSEPLKTEPHNTQDNVTPKSPQVTIETAKGTENTGTVKNQKQEIKPEIKKESLTPIGTSGFAKQQYRLALPTQGKIKAKFGEKKEHGGYWNGVFISAENAPVKAIYSGKIVFVGFLKGYGQTIIIDHEDGYLSVYTALANTSVSMGKTIQANTQIARTGTLPTGEKGLYFEIRYQTKPLNPLSWVK